MKWAGMEKKRKRKGIVQTCLNPNVYLVDRFWAYKYQKYVAISLFSKQKTCLHKTY